jgi:beta-lactamase class A
MRRLPILILIICVCSLRLAGKADQGQTEKQTALSQVLERELSHFQAQTGVFVKNLATKEEAGIRAEQPFNSFSVIKLAIMVRAYQLSDQGKLNLNDRVEIRRSDLRDGSGILYTFDPGMKLTVRDLITQMIITSDNTATDMVLARVGGVNSLNAWLRDTGFGQTRMVQTILDFFRQPLVLQNAKYKSLSSEEVFAYWVYPSQISIPRLKEDSAVGAQLQKEVPFAVVGPKIYPLWSSNPEYWIGSMTARETARMLEGIETGTLASKDSSEQMKRILMEQREGRLRIPHYLPDLLIGHKTGDGPPVIANDVGIVYAPNGPIIISFFSASNTASYPDHEDRIGALSRAVVDYFEKHK